MHFGVATLVVVEIPFQKSQFILPMFQKLVAS